MSACTGVPLSHLVLERHHLGERAGAERARVEEHLASCEACRSTLARIEADDGRALPPLPVPLRPARRWGARAVPIVSGLALAAALLLFLGRRPKPFEPAVEPGARVKGSDVAFALVRDDDAVIADGGGVYRDGDRFKALVTCPPGMRATWDVVVYEHGETSFPLAPASEVACGNAIPLPGAFRVTGQERLTVCLVWHDDGPVDRAKIRAIEPAALGRARCLTLDAAR